jgi:hypothetical protein
MLHKNIYISYMCLEPNFTYVSSSFRITICLCSIQNQFHRQHDFNFQHLLFPSKSSGKCLRLLPRLHVTSILPSIFPSVTRFRRRFLRKVLLFQLVFFLFFMCMTPFSFLNLCNNFFHFSQSRSNWPLPILPQHQISKLSTYGR